jgi:hypothetical protein
MFTSPGLSRLVAASFTEDVFGVVQKVEYLELNFYLQSCFPCQFISHILISDIAVYIDLATRTSSGIHLFCFTVYQKYQSFQLNVDSIF